MRKIVSLRKVVQSADSSRDGWELCALAELKYDAASSTVLVELDSSVQPVHLPPGVDGFRQPWLAAKKIVKRRVLLREARVVAREVFRRTVPSQVHRSAD